MAFDVRRALQEGYSYSEIAEYLAGKRKFNLVGARNEGYSDEEIVKHLSFEPTIGGQLKEAVKGIVPGAIGLVEQAAVGASALLPDQYEAGAQEAIRGVAAAAKKPFAPEAGYEETVGRKFGEAAGSFVPFLGLGALGVAGRVGAGALATGSGAGEALTRAQQEGATPGQQSLSTGLGAVVGLSELFAPFRILSRIPEGEVLSAANRIKRVAMAGGEEAAQEAAAGLAQNLIARGVYKPEQQLIEGLGEQAAYGGAVGALAQGLLDVALGRRAKTAATPAQPTTPAVEEQPAITTPAAPTAPTTFAPARGVPETATQQDLFTEENIQRTAQSTREAQDRLFKLRDEFDLYQRENERLAAAYEREADPVKKQQIYDQAVALAKPLNELKTQIEAVKGTLGAAEGARPGTGEPQLDFEAPLPSIGDRVGQVAKTEYRPDTGTVIGEEAAAPRLNEQQQRMLEEQRVQGIRDKIAAGEPVTQADMMRVKFLERDQYQEEAAKPTPALDLSQQKVTRFPLTLQRTDIEQQKMKVQEQPAAPETRPVTEQDFRTMGVAATNKKLRSELLGKDLSNPEDRRFVKERLEAFASDPNRSPGIVKKVENFLDSPIFFEQMELPLAPRRKQRVKQPKQPVAGASEPSVSVPDQGAAVAAPGPQAPVATGVGEPALRTEPRDVAEREQPAPVNPEVEALRRQYQRRVEKGTMELADAKPIENLLANPTPENINQARQILKGTAAVGEGIIEGVALTPEEQRALDKEAKATVRREGAGEVKIPGTLYRTQRSEEQAAGMDPAIVEEYVAQIVDGWKNAPVIDVVNTPADLPKRLREGTDIQPGLFDPVTGHVFVIASNLKNELDLFQTVLHETVGHYGMRSLLGDSYTRVMNNLYNGNEQVREAAKEKMEANPKLTKEVAVEEFLAEVAERNIKPNPSKADKSLGNQIVRFFRNALRKLFGKKADLISDTEVLDIVAEARMFVQTGTPTQGYKNVSDRDVPLYRTPEGKNIQYHAGDLGYGDDTVLGRMSGGRSTGHFGTGVYFVSNQNKLPDIYKARGIKEVDLSPYNLFKPRSTSQAQELHKALRLINKLASDSEEDSPITPKTAEKELREISSTLPFEIRFNLKADKKISSDEAEELVKKYAAEAAEEARKLYKDYRFERDFLDSASTRFMKKLGYEGVDASGTDLDNTEYGTVVYAKDLSDKANTPLYRTPKPTLTAAGQQAQAAVAAMAGITNAKPKGPQMSTLQKVGAFFQDPSYRQDQIDKFRVQVAYKGAAAESKLAMLNQYNGKIRDALGNIRPDVFMTAAEHADTMAVAVMKDGKLKLDPKVGWVAEKGTASFQGVIDKIKDLGTKLGDQQLAFKLANDAFIARRANYFKQHPQLGISGLPDDAKIKAGMQAFKDFPELEAAFKEFTTFKNNLIDAGVDAGRFSKEQAAEWKEAADYVPWNRIKDYEDKIATSPQAYFRGLTNLKQMKEIRGGTDEINDIFDNMVGLSFWLVNGAIRNHAAVQLTDAFVSNGLGARQVRQGQPGVDPNKTIYIYRDGKPEVYEYESIADVYAFKGVESMGGPILSSFTAFANILRRTTTATPQFAASQLFQDAYRATVTSGVKNPFEVAAKVLTGAVDAYRGDATTQQLEKFGIVGAYDLMPGRAKDEIEKEFGIRQRSVLEKGLSFMESFSIASDASLRKAVFEQTLEETKSPQFPDGDVLLARYRAQEVINFKRQGANRTVGLMRQLIPFMNAYIQGMDVFYRTMTGRGVAATERSEAFKMFLSTGVKLAALTTIYTMLVGDDDEYEGLRDYEKDKNFIVPGTGVKIPVAPEVGFFFKVIPERLYNYITSQGTERPQDAAALRKAIGTAAFDAFSGPNLTPQAVKPALELLVNYSFFTGTPIVGRGLEKLEPAQQFTDSTSEIAKMIGALAGISPMKLEYFVRGTTGIAGGTVLDLSNMLFTDRPDKRLYEMPAFKTFMYDKIPGGYKEQYYDLREKVEQVVYTMNGLKAQGRAEELQEYLNDDRINLLALRRSMNQIDQQLEKMRAFRKLISNDPTMTGAEKKDRLDEIERTENELLRAYNIPALRKEVAGL